MSACLGCWTQIVPCRHRGESSSSGCAGRPQPSAGLPSLGVWLHRTPKVGFFHSPIKQERRLCFNFHSPKQISPPGKHHPRKAPCPKVSVLESQESVKNGGQNGNYSCSSRQRVGFPSWIPSAQRPQPRLSHTEGKQSQQ